MTLGIRFLKSHIKTAQCLFLAKISVGYERTCQER